MARARRREVTVAVTLSIAPGVTLAEAKREIRTRVNELCGYYSHVEESDVRIRRLTKWQPN